MEAMVYKNNIKLLICWQSKIQSGERMDWWIDGLMYKLDGSMDQWIDQMIYELMDWSIDIFTDGWIDWSIYWSMSQWFDVSINWLIVRLMD